MGKHGIDYPPVWLAGFMALGWGVSHLGRIESDALLWLGRVLILAGVAMALWAARSFWLSKTTIVPHREPTALVESGPYRYSRNPIYVADLLILAGWVFTLGAPHLLVLLAPFAWILQRNFILPEEERLRSHLGEPYVGYCDRVRRWI